MSRHCLRGFWFEHYLDGAGCKKGLGHTLGFGYGKGGMTRKGMLADRYERVFGLIVKISMSGGVFGRWLVRCVLVSDLFSKQAAGAELFSLRAPPNPSNG